jgi:hypothetical protein
MHTSFRSVVGSRFLLLAALLGAAPLGHATSPPVPKLSDARVSATVSYDSATFRYTYTYSIENPSTNTGEVRDLWLDITHRLDREFWFSINHPVPQYKSVVRDQLQKQGIKVLPVEVQAPGGWDADNLSVGGYAVWGWVQGPRLAPGRSQGGFVLRVESPRRCAVLL